MRTRVFSVLAALAWLTASVRISPALARGAPAVGAQAVSPIVNPEWQQASTGLDDQFQAAISAGYGGDQTVFAYHATNGVYRSMQAGRNWQRMWHGMSVVGLSPTYAADGVVLGHGVLSGTPGLLRSADGGVTWTNVWPNIPSVTAIVFSPAFASDRTVFVSSGSRANGGVWKSTDGGATWQTGDELIHHSIQTNNYGVVYLELSPNFAGDGTLWAGTVLVVEQTTHYFGHAYRSTDRGQTWHMADDGLTKNLYDLAASPNYANDQTVYGSSFPDPSKGTNGLVWKSTDGGLNWAVAGGQPPAVPQSNVSVSPNYAFDSTVFIGTNDGVYRSTDAGASWTRLGFAGVYVGKVAVSPAYAGDRTLFVNQSTGSGQGLYVSYDAGATWSRAGVTGRGVFALAASPNYASDQSLWAGASGVGVFRSTDGGDTWLTTALNDQTISALAASPNIAADGTVWAGTYTNLYRSTDGGATWSSTTSGLTDTYISVIAVSPDFVTDRTVWVGTSSGLFRSTNAGDTWSFSSANVTTTVLSLAVSPNYSADRTLYLVANGVFRSTDGGATWTGRGLHWVSGAQPAAESVAISPDYASDQTLWAGTYSHGVYRSTDGSATWLAPTTVISNNLQVLATGAGADKVMWTITTHGVYNSTDGLVWTPRVDGLLNTYVRTAAYAPSAETLWLGTNDAGVWRARPAATSPRSSTITPSAGGSLTSWDGNANVNFAPGTVVTDTTATLTPVTSSRYPLPAGMTGLRFFDLECSALSGGAVTPSQAYTLTMGYSLSEISGFQASGLALFYWNGSAWVQEVSQVDTNARRVTATPNHFSEFALMSSGYRLFLPYIVR